MGKIQLLPQNIINKIAAGEVVERPSSVVKELVENSIDAEATEISIRLEGGGIKSLTIEDNGVGMSPEDAENCYILHTTSKVSKLEDLNQIQSFGFRGEALASISAVSEVKIHTKAKNTDGVFLIVENGEQTEFAKKPRSLGTTITVNDLFRHLPARKKFLRTENTEYKHAFTDILRQALAHPHVAFNIYHNEKLVLKLAAHGNDSKNSETTEEARQKRFLDIHKNYIKEDIIPIFFDSKHIGISGFILNPTALTKDKSRQYFFVNGRFILDRALTTAVKQGYKTSIPREFNPVFVINITVDPREVDVNIHPRKLEVKFSNQSEIFKYIVSSVKSALENRVQNEHREAFSGSNNLKSPILEEANRATNYSSSNFSFSNSSNPKTTRATFSVPKSSKGAILDSLKFSEVLLSKSESESDNEELTSESREQTRQNQLDLSINRTEETLQLEQAPYQIFATYIVYTVGEKLIILDQHAADERVKYEYFLEKFRNKSIIESQKLILPIKIELTNPQIPEVEANLGIFEQLGLDAEVKDDNLLIKSIPEVLRDINYKALVGEIIEYIGGKENSKLDATDEDNLIEPMFKNIASSLACHGSIRAGRKLNPPEMTRLITDLDKCKFPNSCPHGRPLKWILTKTDLEKQFLRTI